MLAHLLGEREWTVCTNQAMVGTKFSHLMLDFGSNLLLFCSVMSGDYKAVITWFQLITGSWQDSEIPD